MTSKPVFQNLVLRTMALSPLFKTSAIPVAIHLVLWWLLYLVTIIRVEHFNFNASQVSLAYWSWLWLAVTLTAFINFIALFRKDFEYHMLMSVPRHIFAGRYLQMGILYCLLNSVLILIDLSVLRFLNHAYGFREFDFLSVVYGTGTAHLVPQLLVVFSMLMLFSSLGTVIGSSTYRFGMPFVWGFWLTVGLGSSMLLALSGALGYFRKMSDTVIWFLGGGPQGGPFVGALHFMVVSVIFMFIVYRNIRKLQLK